MSPTVEVVFVSLHGIGWLLIAVSIIVAAVTVFVAIVVAAVTILVIVPVVVFVVVGIVAAADK